MRRVGKKKLSGVFGFKLIKLAVLAGSIVVCETEATEGWLCNSRTFFQHVSPKEAQQPYSFNRLSEVSACCTEENINVSAYKNGKHF